jgi:DNA polymerase III subunit alpha
MSARLEFELGIIEQMGFPGYFLIVADFIKWAKAQDIPVGPGRGSGAGSLVAYALTITDLDPLRYSLLFERFLNPERVSMPDFDIDFCMDRREEVIRYTQEKYGREKVGQIITFGALLSKAAVRDVGRVLQLPYGQVDKLSKLIPLEGVKPVIHHQGAGRRAAPARSGKGRGGRPPFGPCREDRRVVAQCLDPCGGGGDRGSAP